MISFVLLVFILSGTVHAALNGGCTVGNTPGVCITTKSCSSSGGTSHVGFCPSDPTSVQCCTKTCGTGGTCQFSGTCTSGKTKTGLCPGPGSFICCLPGTKACTAPFVNAATVALIKGFEGFVASPSPDPIGLPTVDFGHQCQTAHCAEVPYPFPLTQATATSLLNSDLKTFEACITDDIESPVKLNANQYGALVSWAFNVGCGTAGSSTLISRLNTGENPNTVAAQELPKFDITGGQVLPGLVRRRAAEVALFQKASSAAALPACR